MKTIHEIYIERIFLKNKPLMEFIDLFNIPKDDISFTHQPRRNAGIAIHYIHIALKENWSGRNQYLLTYILLHIST